MTDLLIRWPYTKDGKREVQQEAVELKVWHHNEPDPLNEGLEQLDRYLERLNLSDGTLIIFDRRRSTPPLAERISFSETHTPTGRSVTLLRA